jgi:hypothetical protein
VVEAKSGALVKLATDSLKHAFEGGSVSHNWCGEQNARAVHARRRLRPYPVLSPISACAARRPVPGLPATCASSTPGPELCEMTGF